MASDRTVAAGFDVATERSGSAPRDRRQIVNGLLYLTKTGCPWALLPPCFGPWKTVYDYFRRWSLQGV